MGDPGCHDDVTGPGLMMEAHQILDIRSTEYFKKVAHCTQKDIRLVTIQNFDRYFGSQTIY
eukprot:scaffold1315_cov23-Cyclotella_meneghiniana.AAC.4